MLSQTIEQSMSLLAMVQQPAFCIGDNGAVHTNDAARHLAPYNAEELPHWLADGAEAFDRWDRAEALELPLDRNSQSYSVTIRPLQDGLLFLMHALPTDDEAGAAMAVASQVLRQPLTDLYSQVQFLADKLEDSAALIQAAAIHRQIFRLNRIAANLSDLDLLRNNQYRLHTQRLDSGALLTPLMEELSDLVRAANRTLTWTPLKKNIFLQGDSSLLQRAILNLVSNALKFSPAGSPIAIQAEVTDLYLLIQVQNQCDDGGAELLRGAFDRLRQRDLLPDPRWGVGLGLPLAQAIARLHGGMVALEVRDGTAIVTLSISRRRSADAPVLEAPVFSYTGGIRQTLLELADALPSSVYHRDAL